MSLRRWLVLVVWGLLWSSPAEAGLRRFALLTSNNEGAKGSQPLVFADDDLGRMEGVLTELGGYEPGDVVALRGALRRQVLGAFGKLRERIAEARAAGDEVVFLFYYSGHADDDRLQLGTGSLTYDELEALLDLSGADVRLAFLDACRSGALTRAKGVTPVPSFVFDVSERLGSEGTVIVTSSTGDENSQESDEIGGSYFTHFLVSALYGAADRDGDRQVTLAEAYVYVYEETVLRTSSTRSGVQHPSFGWDLTGAGELVLSDLGGERAALEFSGELDGAYAIFDVTRRQFVAEVDLGQAGGQDRRLVVRPGQLQIQERFPTHMRVADVVVQPRQRVEVASLDFEAVQYKDDVAKGPIQRKLRKARLPDSSVRLVVGPVAPMNPEVRDTWVPNLMMGGVSWRLHWREGRWLSVDVLGGGGEGVVAIEGLDPEPVAMGGVVVGSGAGFVTADRIWQLGAGLRADAILLSRTWPDDPSVPTQGLATLAPGVVHFAGLRPGRVQLDVEYRVSVVPVRLEVDDPGFFVHAVLLSGGYLF